MLKIYNLIFILFFFALFMPVEAANELHCSVTWAAGTFNGKGHTINEALEDARRACKHHQNLGSHECGSAPNNINCIDKNGKCINQDKFLQHGLMGGNECK